MDNDLSGSDPTARLVAKVNQLFPAADRRQVLELLATECAENLPLAGGRRDTFERVQAAVVKLSGGTLPGLREALRVAKIDWRDSLMAAGFGHSLTAHEAWLES